MASTYEELSYAVFCLSTRNLPAEDIPQEVLNRLAEIDMIRFEKDAAPMLTPHGQLTYRKIMGIERKHIPEFDLGRSPPVSIVLPLDDVDSIAATGEALARSPGRA